MFHPVQFARFFFLMVGNVLPTSLYQVEPQFQGLHEVLGVAVCFAAAFVVIQVLLQAVGGDRRPGGALPLILIAFGFLFDLNIALGRVGQGILGAVNETDRYTMPNIIIVVGVVVYALVHLPELKLSEIHRGMGWKKMLSFGRFGAAALLIVLLVVGSTIFGIRSGNSTKQEREFSARVAVNLDEIPASERACYFGGPLAELIDSWRSIAIKDQLSVFQPGVEAGYRVEGAPVLRQCEKRS